MIRVGITGQEGFVGGHLYNFLGTQQNIERVTYDISFFSDPELLANFVSSCDVVMHLAAVNRHESQEELYRINVELVEKLISATVKANHFPKILFSSSIQEEKDNLYGKSKKKGRELLEKYALSHNTEVCSLVIPNVFGPFGMPFYNSFVATFSHQLCHGETPTIQNDALVDLIYVGELCQEFTNKITETASETTQKYEVKPTAQRKVTEVLSMLVDYKEKYVEKGIVPDFQDTFSLNLFNTFVCYLPKDYFPRPFVLNKDPRGMFVEVMRAETSGQSSYSTTAAGITRGNHYHTRKVERFAVIKGKAKIQWRRMGTDEVIDFFLDGEAPSYVDMPIWTTHNIQNIGEEELLTLFWINEPYDPADPDTYFENV